MGTPYLTGPADFPNGTIELTKYTTRPSTVCETGDILITVKGSGCGTLTRADDRYCISRQLMAVRAGEWNADFLKYSLLVNATQIRAAITGLIPGLSRSDILDQAIPVPLDRHEQDAIASALFDVDCLIESLDALITKKQVIKQATMQQLLTGKTRLPGFSGKWNDTTIGAVADIRNGSTPSTQVPAYWNGSIPWCTPTDITGTRSKYLEHTARNITEAGLASCAASLLPPGTLLLCSRATIGELKIARTHVCTNQGFKSLVCHDGTSHEFLYYLIQTLKSQLIERAIGSTFLEIGKRDLAAIPLTLPLEDEQAAIAKVLSDMDREIESLEQRRDKTQQIKQGMMQQLLTGRVRLVAPEGATESC